MIHREEVALVQETMEALKSLDINSTRERLQKIESNVKRITSLLHELKDLSKVCQELEEGCKETKIFTRRVIQLKTELEDTKDLLYTLVESRLTSRQLGLLSFDEPFHDPSFDPSIRFFGIDWEQIFGKCFNVSISIKMFSSGLLAMKEDSQIDIFLLNSIFMDLSGLEAEISSHAEAVLNGRLSKSQLQLILEEQTRLKTMFPPNPLPKPLKKAKSFQDSNRNSKRTLTKYRKNKTSELQHRFSTDLGAQSENETERKTSLDGCPESFKRKNSIIQNVSNILKNIR